MGFIDFLGDNLVQFWEYTGFANCTLPHLAMILVGLFFIYLAIKKNFEPMLLVPIGFGILIGNIPFKIDAGLEGSECRLVSAVGLFRYWSNDRFLVAYR